MRPATGAFTHTIYLQFLTVGKGMVQQLLKIRITQARISLLGGSIQTIISIYYLIQLLSGSVDADARLRGLRRAEQGNSLVEIIDGSFKRDTRCIFIESHGHKRL